FRPRYPHQRRNRPARRPQDPQAGPDAAAVPRAGSGISMSGLILYTTEDGASRIQLRADGQTVWLTQAEMAELFDVTTDNISLHLKNIFSDKELEPERTTEESSVVQREGGRDVRRPVTLYNLDAILAVGYRVRSPRGVQFR